MLHPTMHPTDTNVANHPPSTDRWLAVVDCNVSTNARQQPRQQLFIVTHKVATNVGRKENLAVMLCALVISPLPTNIHETRRRRMVDEEQGIEKRKIGTLLPPHHHPSSYSSTTAPTFVHFRSHFADLLCFPDYILLSLLLLIVIRLSRGKS